MNNEMDALKKDQERLTAIMLNNANFVYWKAKNDPCGNAMEEKYFNAQSQFNKNRTQINNLLDIERQIYLSSPEYLEKQTAFADKSKREYERAVRENMVTSTTYIRSQKILLKKVDGFLTGHWRNKI